MVAGPFHVCVLQPSLDEGNLDFVLLKVPAQLSGLPGDRRRGRPKGTLQTVRFGRRPYPGLYIAFGRGNTFNSQGHGLTELAPFPERRDPQGLFRVVATTNQ